MNKQMPFGIFLTGGRRLLVPVLLAAVYVILPIKRSDAAVVCSRAEISLPAAQQGAAVARPSKTPTAADDMVACGQMGRGFDLCGLARALRDREETHLPGKLGTCERRRAREHVAFLRAAEKKILCGEREERSGRSRLEASLPSDTACPSRLRAMEAAQFSARQGTMSGDIAVKLMKKSRAENLRRQKGHWGTNAKCPRVFAPVKCC
jgi:hypothetical protein